MTNPTTKKSQRVRFEEVTPTNEIVAYFNAQLPSLVAGTGLRIFPGYDDLDYIQFAYITLPSGNTVVLGQYEDAPEIGVDLYVDLALKYNSTAISTNIAALVVETLRYLVISKETAIWFHPDYEIEIESLYSQDGEFESIPKIPTEESTLSTECEPIDCFYYALEIYTREKLPEYWAMLQHNLGLAYFDRSKGERRENLQKSIECFHKSLEVFTKDKFPAKWQINQEDLKESQKSLDSLLNKQRIVNDIRYRPIIDRDLRGADLSGGIYLVNIKLIGANLSGANLSGSYLSSADLRRADLRGADLSGADLSRADLSGANLNGTTLIGADLRGVDLSGANMLDADVKNTRFQSNSGIDEVLKQYLSARGALFEDYPGDRFESRTLAPR